MNLPVVLTRTAEQQLWSATDWYAARDPELGERWFRGIHEAIKSLAENPERFGLAHENDDLPVGLREMLYGVGRRKSHRVLFIIRDDRIVVHQVRHVSQRDFLG